MREIRDLSHCNHYLHFDSVSNGCMLGIGSDISWHGMISAQDAGNVVQGVTIFLVIYFIAQLIERIIEFISNIPIFKDSNKIAKLQKEIDRMDSGTKALLKESPHASVCNKKYRLEELMDRQNCLESSRRSRLLAAASGLGIIFGYFFIGLFVMVGIPGIPHWIDALFTG